MSYDISNLVYTYSTVLRNSVPYTIFNSLDPSASVYLLKSTHYNFNEID